MFKEGDWIIDKSTKRMGYIVGISSALEECSIKWVRYADGSKSKATGIKFFDQIEPASLDLQHEDFTSLIEMALATKDKDWFERLTNEKERTS